MLTADDLRVVLASESLRQAHGLELPQESLTALAGNPGTFAHFYEQWSAQGQPRYVPPAAQPVAQAQPAAAPAAVQAAPVAAPAPVAPPAPVAAPAPPAPDFGPPPTPRPAPQFSAYSRDPAAATFAASAAPAVAPSTIAPPVSPYASSPYGAAPYSSTGYLGPHAVISPNVFSPNAVMPTGLNRPGMKMMLWGFGAAVVGIIITVVTFVAAAPGQTFVVAWGAIIFGSIRGIMGAVHLSRGS